ncbi:MAG: GGDEF domain-containing protein, partial [Candidatus Limnocylindrales bacterium]
MDGTIVAASTGGLAGQSIPDQSAVEAANGQPAVAFVAGSESGAAPGDLGSPTVLREYLPISAGGSVRAIVGIWRDGVPVLARLDGVRREVVAVTLSAACLAAIVLFLIFRAAQGRLTRQTADLLEATHRDALTETLNHGALVAHLAAAIEMARISDMPLGVALVDVDNFRLLNDNHGHQAGDQALLAVMTQLRHHVPGPIVMGRYGPDEFLLIAPSAAVVELEPAIAHLRNGLADLSLQFDATERLPVTISAGICTYP